MKIKKELVKRDVAGDTILVPVGKTVYDSNWRPFWRNTRLRKKPRKKTSEHFWISFRICRSCNRLPAHHSVGGRF